MNKHNRLTLTNLTEVQIRFIARLLWAICKSFPMALMRLGTCRDSARAYVHDHVRYLSSG